MPSPSRPRASAKIPKLRGSKRAPSLFMHSGSGAGGGLPSPPIRITHLLHAGTKETLVGSSPTCYFNALILCPLCVLPLWEIGRRSVSAVARCRLNTLNRKYESMTDALREFEQRISDGLAPFFFGAGKPCIMPPFAIQRVVSHPLITAVMTSGESDSNVRRVYDSTKVKTRVCSTQRGPDSR